MTVLVEPFGSVYDDRNRLGVILARGRSGFEAYAADDHSLGLFPSPRTAAAAITIARPWVATRGVPELRSPDSITADKPWEAIGLCRRWWFERSRWQEPARSQWKHRERANE
jgi:hypothetical protein